MKLSPYLLLLVALNTMPSHAYEDTMERLIDLPLEQLMSIKVITVSKRQEDLVEAPGIVTVISAEEIAAFGARNVKDILLRAPHLYIFDSSTFTASGATLRAGASQHLNNHVLYLINGKPIREAQNGGLHTDINLLFPIEAIERIELIRGPGSVLYGSNAFNGTINIITKIAQESPRYSADLSYGSHKHRSGNIAIEQTFNKDFGLEIHATRHKEDGDTINPADEAGQIDGPIAQSRDGSSVFLNAKLKGFTLNGFVSEITTPIFSGAFLWPNLAEFELKREYIDAEYRHTFGKQWTLTSHYTYNMQERLVIGPGTRTSQFKANGYTYEASLNGHLTSKLDLLVGGIIDQLRGDLFVRGGQYESKREGIYGQFDYRISEATKLTAGVQWNHPEGIDSNTSPRLALIHRIAPRWSTKLLYAEAFRSPYGSELFFDAGFLQGDTELKPEKIDTAEAQLLYSDNSHSLTTTFFHSKSTDTISRAFVNGTNTFVNNDNEIKTMGLELEASWSINSHWRLQGNYSFQSNKDAEGHDNIMPAPRSMMKYGLVYRSANSFRAGLWNSYFGAASKTEAISSNTLVINPESKSVNLLSLNLAANMGDLTQDKRWNMVELSFYANNLLDEEVWFPETSRRRVNTYPQSHARSLVSTIRFSF